MTRSESDLKSLSTANAKVIGTAEGAWKRTPIDPKTASRVLEAAARCPECSAPDGPRGMNHSVGCHHAVQATQFDPREQELAQLRAEVERLKRWSWAMGLVMAHAVEHDDENCVMCRAYKEATNEPESNSHA